MGVAAIAARHREPEMPPQRYCSRNNPKIQGQSTARVRRAADGVDGVGVGPRTLGSVTSRRSMLAAGVSSHFSQSMAAAQPEPAAVIAWR